MAEATNTLKRNYADIATVTLIVGPEKRNFHIHDSKLFTSSPLFKRAFNEAEEKGSARVLLLPDSSADLFDTFVHWLYSGILTLPRFAPNQKEKGTVMCAVRLYIMASKFEITQLKNAICKALFTLVPKADFHPPPHCALQQAYKHTPADSALRRLLVDWLVYQTESEWFKGAANQALLLSLKRLSLDVNVAFSQGGGCDPEDGPFRTKKADWYDEDEVKEPEVKEAEQKDYVQKDPVEKKSEPKDSAQMISEPEMIIID